MLGLWHPPLTWEPLTSPNLCAWKMEILAKLWLAWIWCKVTSEDRRQVSALQTIFLFQKWNFF